MPRRSSQFALCLMAPVLHAELSIEQLPLQQQCHSALVTLERYPDLWNAWIANRMSLLVSGLLIDDQGHSICTQTELDFLEVGALNRPATVSSLEAWKKIFGDHCPGGPSLSLCDFFQGCGLLPHSIALSGSPGNLTWADLHMLCTVETADTSWISQLVQAAQQPARGLEVPLSPATKKYDIQDDGWGS